MRLCTMTLVLIFCMWFVNAAAAQAPASKAVDVYYSSADTDITPAGNVRFHGPFSNEMLTVRADDLPAHDFLEITFDFLAIRSLDGSVPMKENRPVSLGPDFFRLGLENGPTLFYTTLSNRPDDPGFHVESKYQNYPSQVPGDHLAPQTGAAAKNTLGYAYPWLGAPQRFPMDATYHIDFIVPDSSRHNAVHLTGMNLQNIIDESWGVTDVTIRALQRADVPHPDEAAIAKAFDASLDPTVDDLAGQFQTLILGMDQTVKWIKDNVAAQPVDTDQIAKLIKSLAADDDHLQEREDAYTNLVQIGPLAEPYLRDRRTTAVGDLRQRLDWALECISDTAITDDGIRRALLATRVLEIIGTPEALDLRKTLTKNDSKDGDANKTAN
jgi:hypothetical protein